MAIKTLLKRYVLPFLLIGILYAIIEYLISLGTATPEPFWPLLLRACLQGLIIGSSIGLFDLKTKKHFVKRPFLYLVLVKVICYTLILSFWLIIGNALWEIYSDPSLTILDGALRYISQPIYLINLTTIFGVILIYSSLVQINSLHRKGELLNFVTGRYHQPVEVDRIFAFVDLKGSTTIAENLGHKRFGLFLKDYYADINEPLREHKAEIYQYVGDEVVLSWSPKVGLKEGNAIKCILSMEQAIERRSDHFKHHYGHVPVFRTGMHLGRVLVTWVGELKKEILYIGDVMNTAKRIQEDCKRLNTNLLISGDIAKETGNQNGLKVKFVEKTIPRGKEKPIELYTVNNQ